MLESFGFQVARQQVFAVAIAVAEVAEEEQLMYCEVDQMAGDQTPVIAEVALKLSVAVEALAVANPAHKMMPGVAAHKKIAEVAVRNSSAAAHSHPVAAAVTVGQHTDSARPVSGLAALKAASLVQEHIGSKAQL